MSAFPSNVSDLKKTIRRDMLARRDALAPSETERARDVLWSRLENILRDAGEKSAAPLTVMSYMAFRGEFPTEDCAKISGNIIRINDIIIKSDVGVIKWLTGYTVDADFYESPYISDLWNKNPNLLKK